MTSQNGMSVPYCVVYDIFPELDPRIEDAGVHVEDVLSDRLTATEFFAGVHRGPAHILGEETGEVSTGGGWQR